MTTTSSSSAEITDEEAPTFDVIPLSAEVRRAVDELGYTSPTPVQIAVFESVASRRDVVVQARTGTGKTAAFGLPIVDRLVDVSEKAPQILILSPTRELALQINRELENLAKHKDVDCTAVYGGAAMQPQVDAIRRGVQVIAGTPGRVLDHLERGTLNPQTIQALVLDESDEMLSMGFLPQITKIMEALPSKHQTLLFSATLPADVRRIAETRLTDPEFITLSGDHIGALSIDHYVYRSTGNKAEELVQILEIENPESAIIFCNTKDQTKRISGALNRKGYASDWLNADLAQNDREKVMRETREGKLRFLVCTDVAARGIDISHLTHVINADFPLSTENYVHRTGRTGRAGKTGTAISLIAPQDVGNLYMLRLSYKIFPIERELPNAGDLQTRKESDLVDFLHKAFSEQPQLPGDRSLARRVLTSDVAEVIVAGLLRDHLGGHPDVDADAASQRRERKVPPTEEVSRKKASKRRDERKSNPKGATTQRLKHDDSKRDDSKRDDSKRGKTLRRAPSPKEHPRSKLDSEHERPNGPLEVISASTLLDASERAVLDGSFQEGTSPQKSPSATTKGSDKVSTTSDVGRVFVDVGKRDEVNKDDFFDTLEDHGFPSEEIEFVKVYDTHSFVGVPPSLLKDAVLALNGCEVAGLIVKAEKARARR